MLFLTLKMFGRILQIMIKEILCLDTLFSQKRALF